MSVLTYACAVAFGDRACPGPVLDSMSFVESTLPIFTVVGTTFERSAGAGGGVEATRVVVLRW